MILRPSIAESEASESSSDYWMTYSDLMANLLLVFALVLSVMMLLSQRAQWRTVEQKAELESLRARAEEQLGIRKKIIEQIREKLKDYDVKVDPNTGAILIAAEVLFGQGEDRVTEEGKGALRKVMAVYASVLLDHEEFRNHLSRIIIEGHTNDDAPARSDPYVFNLDLSQRRAFNVMRFIIDEYRGTSNEQLLKRYMVASGRSLVDLICINGARGSCPPGDVDKARSRRIEIKFSLKDEDAIKQLARILAGAR